MKLIMLKPRNAKKVSAMLPTMSLTGGYVDGASKLQSAVNTVMAAIPIRMTMTSRTRTAWALAMAFAPPSELSTTMPATIAVASSLMSVADCPPPVNSAVPYVPNEVATMAMTITVDAHTTHASVEVTRPFFPKPAPM